MSARETVLDAIKATLLADSATATLVGTRVYRSRREQIGTLPAINIEEDGGDIEEIVLGKADHTLNVRITAYATADTPDTGANAVLAAAHAALTADRTLGQGADVQLMPTVQLDNPEIDGFDYIGLAHRYTVFIRTAATAI